MGLPFACIVAVFGGVALRLLSVRCLSIGIAVSVRVRNYSKCVCGNALIAFGGRLVCNNIVKVFGVAK